MTATAQAPPTVGGILYPDGDAPGTISNRLESAALLAGVVLAAKLLPGDALLLHRKAAGAVIGLLDLDVAEVLLDAWRAEGALLDAARATAAEPGRTDHVRLATQRVRWRRRPSVDLYVDRTPRGSITVELSVELEIAALEADLQSGRLTGLDAGRSTVSVRLAVEGLELASRSEDIDLKLTVPLGSGIALAPPIAGASVDR